MAYSVGHLEVPQYGEASKHSKNVQAHYKQTPYPLVQAALNQNQLNS